jgi:hypothetical protein
VVVHAVFQEVARPARVVRNLTVVEGRQAVLLCNHAVSRPTATVSWYSVVAADATSSSSSSSSSSALHWTVSGGVEQPVQENERIAFDDSGE